MYYLVKPISVLSSFLGDRPRSSRNYFGGLEILYKRFHQIAILPRSADHTLTNCAQLAPPLAPYGGGRVALRWFRVEHPCSSLGLFFPLSKPPVCFPCTAVET